MNEEIKKIDMCEVCFDKKAIYSYYKEKDMIFFGTRLWRALVCENCIKKIKSGEVGTK